MKKIFMSLLMVFSLTLLVSCHEITEEHNKAQKPQIELITKGELIQIYEENQKLEDVEFTLNFKKFQENEISLDDVTIHWYISGFHMTKYDNMKSIIQEVKSPSETSVRVVVTFKFEGKTETLEENALIQVKKVDTKILVTNSLDDKSHRVNSILGKNNEITFEGTISGNLNHNVIKWVVQRQTGSEPEFVYERILEESDLTIINNEAKSTFKYKFMESGNYIVTLQTGEGTSQDANKKFSNSTHINVGYGNFELTTVDEKVLTLANVKNRTLTVTDVDTSVLGEGRYEWYLNNMLIEDENTKSITHDSNLAGGFLYQVKFVPTDPLKPTIATDPLLIVTGVEVSNQEELDQALNAKKAGIILTNDIHYESTNRLNINYQTTIYGNGKQLESSGTDVFLNITSDNVYLSNLKVVRATKYNILYNNVVNGYLENIELEELGGDLDFGNLTSGDFGAGVFVDNSEVTVKNINFIDGGMIGIRIDNENYANNKVEAKLNVLGVFNYNVEDPVILPIGSGKSSADAVLVNAQGFDYFALPAGGITIRRWDNIGDPISWEIYDPIKTDYLIGEYLDLFRVGIKVDISFLMEGIEISDEAGLEFVKLYIKLFKQYGKIDITNMNDDIVKTYYIIGELSDREYGMDLLRYSLNKDLNSDHVEPKLPEEKGQYKIKISIGEEFYLGHFIIDIKEE